MPAKLVKRIRRWPRPSSRSRRGSPASTAAPSGCSRGRPPHRFPAPARPPSTIGLLIGAHVFAVTFWLGPIGLFVRGDRRRVCRSAATAWRVRSCPSTSTNATSRYRCSVRSPWLDDVRLTTISVQGGRAFAFPGADGRTYLNLGHRGFNAALDGTRSYPAIGQILVHELVHAWQMAHSKSLAAFLSHAAEVQIRNELGERVYDIGSAPVVWADCNLEQQATAVDRWYAGKRSPPAARWTPKAPTPPPSPMPSDATF